jgi:hypothetical protein
MAKTVTSRPKPNVPARSLPKYEAITALTDAFCKEHLNEEYAQMCRQLAAVLSGKQPTPLRRGREEVWACGIVRTIGWVNMLDDPSGSPHMKLIAIDPEFGVAESTGQGKSKAIRRMLGIGRLCPSWTLPSRIGDNPLFGKVEVNGVLVDMRQQSREKQEAAFRKGQIPYIPADSEKRRSEQAQRTQDKTDLATFKADVFGALSGFYKKIITLLRQSSLDEEKKKLAGELISQLLENVTEETKCSRDWHVAERLESAYEEVKRLVDELANPHGSGHSGTSPGQEADASG